MNKQLARLMVALAVFVAASAIIAGIAGSWEARPALAANPRGTAHSESGQLWNRLANVGSPTGYRPSNGIADFSGRADGEHPRINPGAARAGRICAEFTGGRIRNRGATA